jgi:hypothetical protein
VGFDSEKERGMNAYESLLAIRDRLEENGASEDSIAMVDKFLDRAEPERDSATNVPMAMIVKHLLRQRETLDNDAIYNDLQEILDGTTRPARDPDAEPYAYEEEKKPRPHSYYKQQKDKERGK